MKTCQTCNYNEAESDSGNCSQCDEWQEVIKWDDAQSVAAQDLFDNYYWNRVDWLSNWELQVTEESEDAIRRESPAVPVFG